jgi:Skp family chaperone for outer membrane proteins
VFIYRIFLAAALAATMSSLLVPPAAAQSSDFFIPGQAKPAQTQQRPATRTAPRPQPASPAAVAPVEPNMPPMGVAGPGEPTDQQPALNVQLPPPPELPPLPPGVAPPTPVVGVMGVPEVMRASSAAQQVQKVVGQRREKLNADAQKEQTVWQDMQRALVNDRAKLSQDQIRSRERELQERITNAQRQFRDRNRVIQEAAQYSLAQIERTLVSVIQQVAKARGMNLVLHRSQVALNVNDFDITDQVTEQLNKILPTVVIPPDGVSPAAMPQQEQKKAPSAAGKAEPNAATPPASQPSVANPPAPLPGQGDQPVPAPAN